MRVIFVLRQRRHATVTVEGQVPEHGSRVYVNGKWWVVRLVEWHVEESEDPAPTQYYARVELDY